jgi:hypothetical protein
MDEQKTDDGCTCRVTSDTLWYKDCLVHDEKLAGIRLRFDRIEEMLTELLARPYCTCPQSPCPQHGIV